MAKTELLIAGHASWEDSFQALVNPGRALQWSHTCFMERHQYVWFFSVVTHLFHGNAINTCGSTKQDVVETTLALDNYRRACDSGRGAVFMSVARGKVSVHASSAMYASPAYTCLHMRCSIFIDSCLHMRYITFIDSSYWHTFVGLFSMDVEFGK